LFRNGPGSGKQYPPPLHGTARGAPAGLACLLACLLACHLAAPAAIVGAVIGSVLAAGAGRRRSPVERVVDRARGAADTLDLAGLGVKLLQNPVIRGYIWSAIESQVKKRISR
jgi:hypothetical protein